MIVDSKEDKKLLLHIIASFPMTGPYIKIGPAVKELDTITLKVEQAQLPDEKNPTGKGQPILKEVK